MNILYIHVFNADTNLTGFDDSVELSSSGTEDKTVRSRVDDLSSICPLAKRPALLSNTEIASFVGSKPISSDSKHQTTLNPVQIIIFQRVVLDVHFSINVWLVNRRRGLLPSMCFVCLSWISWLRSPGYL